MDVLLKRQRQCNDLLVIVGLADGTTAGTVGNVYLKVRRNQNQSQIQIPTYLLLKVPFRVTHTLVWTEWPLRDAEWTTPTQA